ncbi:MAG: hypothetical protein WD492_07540 [Alkalispirochaeta sp.]
MRRLLVLIMVLAVGSAGGTVFAQTEIPGLEDFESGFSGFTDEFTSSLPMNSMIGLNWSDAYVGQLLPFPSFGVGITAGATTIPLSVFEDLSSDLVGTDGSGGDLGDLPSLGIPLPGYAFDARVGGVILPFDVGLKFGTIGDMKVGDVEAEYTNFGFDVRYAVLDGGLVFPKLSVGVGYNYLSGRIVTPLGFGQTEIGSVTYGENGSATVLLSDPKLDFDWTANVFDVKAQVSKSFLIVEPHFGLGAAFGTAETNTGLTASVTAEDENGQDISLDQLESVAGVTIGEQGISLGSDVSTFSLRAFGGASLNLVVFRLDLGVMYNITSGALGGTLGARFQI